MKKLNSTIYNKLLLEAEEANELGLNKLASSVINAIGDSPEENNITYSHNQLQEDVKSEMWKVATHLFQYHNMNSLDSKKTDEILESLASKFIKDLEYHLDLSPIGKLEERLPGENE